jgi:membrane protein DedA with SNARE-associated domain
MAALVWFTVGLALWHFTVFLPDRFWGGIVGAFLGAIVGAMISGAIAFVAGDRTIGETDIATVLVAVPGALVGMGVVYLIGQRAERAEAEAEVA